MTLRKLLRTVRAALAHTPEETETAAHNAIAWLFSLAVDSKETLDTVHIDVLNDFTLKIYPTTAAKDTDTDTQHRAPASARPLYLVWNRTASRVYLLLTRTDTKNERDIIKNTEFPPNSSADTDAKTVVLGSLLVLPRTSKNKSDTAADTAANAETEAETPPEPQKTARTRRKKARTRSTTTQSKNTNATRHIVIATAFRARLAADRGVRKLIVLSGKPIGLIHTPKAPITPPPSSAATTTPADIEQPLVPATTAAAATESSSSPSTTSSATHTTSSSSTTPVRYHDFSFRHDPWVYRKRRQNRELVRTQRKLHRKVFPRRPLPRGDEYRQFVLYNPSTAAHLRRGALQLSSLHHKKQRMHATLVHTATARTVDLMLFLKARELRLEQLSHYEAPSGLGALSAALNQNLWGQYQELITYKLQKTGYPVGQSPAQQDETCLQWVSPAYTSKACSLHVEAAAVSPSSLSSVSGDPNDVEQKVPHEGIITSTNTFKAFVVPTCYPVQYKGDIRPLPSGEWFLHQQQAPVNNENENENENKYKKTASEVTTEAEKDTTTSTAPTAALAAASSAAVATAEAVTSSSPPRRVWLDRDENASHNLHYVQQSTIT